MNQRSLTQRPLTQRPLTSKGDQVTPAQEGRSPLLRSLLEARDLGLLGPGSVEVHREHSIGFSEALRQEWSSPQRAFDLEFAPGARGEGVSLLDLGSGGGVPGMIIAEHWPAANVAVLDSSKKRCELLTRWIEESGWASRVTVLCGRAEDLGRNPELRGTFDAVVSRSFGPPAVTAECASPFLRVDGLLVVSDPPANSPSPGAAGRVPDQLRWPPTPLRQLGLDPLREITKPFHFTILRQVEACPERYPRRSGMPAKRPLFRA
jgi:16S rRNA (guanine527-N7)-methyltransferase